MTNGVAISRQWVCVLRNGSIVLDWGDGRAVDLMRGEFTLYDPVQFSHPVQDDELETLRRMGRVLRYDQLQIFLVSMPELPIQG